MDKHKVANKGRVKQVREAQHRKEGTGMAEDGSSHRGRTAEEWQGRGIK